MSLGSDYLADNCYELEHGLPTPLDYPKTNKNKNMQKTIEEVKLMGEPWTTTSGNILYTFGIKYVGGGKAVANSSSDSPWWGAPGSVVIEVKKGTTTKSGCPKVKYDRPEEEASVATGHMSNAGGSAPKGGGNLIGIKCGASMNRACAAMVNVANPDSEGYAEALLLTAHIIHNVAEQFESEVAAAAAVVAAPTPPPAPPVEPGDDF